MKMRTTIWMTPGRLVVIIGCAMVAAWVVILCGMMVCTITDNHTGMILIGTIEVPGADGSSSVTMPAEFRCAWDADGTLRVRDGQVIGPDTESGE